MSKQEPKGPPPPPLPPPYPHQKLFKKCKSATFQLDGATYTIGQVTRGEEERTAYLPHIKSAGSLLQETRYPPAHGPMDRDNGPLPESDETYARPVRLERSRRLLSRHFTEALSDKL
ncbi:hypothetical protein WN48_00295 [Eufriesea mexicana]|uniref:Uncharacterized protein n=1 Tax=Eufriesea mexicana TaxID=516756 RepID=A0A310S899_9HYME|nr:hypothetical protein WN48_00295 [Eufriesea mexicana]